MATLLQLCKVVAICARCLQPCRVVTTLHDDCEVVVEIVNSILQVKVKVTEGL